jgi:DUF4097 and DUF4098 domain-containing protein YvlB
MRTVIAVIAAATLAPASASAQQHDHVVRVRTAVHVEHTQADRRAVERVRREQARARAEQNRGQSREEQTEKISRTLSASELDLSNLSGDIVIRRGGNAVQVEAVKVARGRTVEEAREMLGFVSVEIAERGRRAEVRAQYPRYDERSRERRNINVSVHYTVTAPENTRIKASSLSGDITVTDIKGELNLVTLSGDVSVTNASRVIAAKSTSGEVELVQVRSEIGLEATSVSGSVTLRDSSAPRARLGSVSGDIVVTNVQSARISAETMSGDVTFTSPLEKNGRYELSSHSGAIRVVPTGDTGFEVDADSFSGNIRSEIPLKDDRQGVAATTPRGRGGRTRSLRGIFGDGSAILDISTFSGTVIIGRK